MLSEINDEYEKEFKKDYQLFGIVKAKKIIRTLFKIHHQRKPPVLNNTYIFK